MAFSEWHSMAVVLSDTVGQFAKSGKNISSADPVGSTFSHFTDCWNSSDDSQQFFLPCFSFSLFQTRSCSFFFLKYPIKVLLDFECRNHKHWWIWVWYRFIKVGLPLIKCLEHTPLSILGTHKLFL